jgi:dihydroflavonol-4-reductase
LSDSGLFMALSLIQYLKFGITYLLTETYINNLILVTGASGFLGTHLLEALIKRGQPIRALYHSTLPKMQHALVTWVACDLLDVYAVQDVMQGISEVYHCAAIVSFDKKDRTRVIEQNQLATAHVVDEALNAGVRRFLHVSSIAALGRASKEQTLISEETFWEESHSNTAYAIGKFQSEMEVWRGMAEGLNAVIINPGIILGEGDFNVGSAKLFQNAYNEFPWYTEGVNGWVDVKDVAKAAILLMKSDITQERYIITAGDYTYKDIFTWMAQAMDRKPPHRKAGPFMSKVAWLLAAIKAFLQGKRSVLTRETVRTAQAICYYDNQKFLKQFPEFSYESMPNTIKRVSKLFLKKI